MGHYASEMCLTPEPAKKEVKAEKKAKQLVDDWIDEVGLILPRPAYQSLIDNIKSALL